MKKGFATSGILYTILLLFVVLLFNVMQNLQNKKTILDQMKVETVNAINGCNNMDSILKRLDSIQEAIGLKEEKTVISMLSSLTQNISNKYEKGDIYIDLSKSNIYTDLTYLEGSYILYKPTEKYLEIFFYDAGEVPNCTVRFKNLNQLTSISSDIAMNRSNTWLSAQLTTNGTIQSCYPLNRAWQSVGKFWAYL